MHGRPRLKGSEDPERTKAAKQKALLFGQLAKEVLSRRQEQRYDEESLALAAKLLELNPEVYTVWNYRREALQPVLDAGGTAAVAAAEGEMALTQKALYRNPKSYSTWHHRKWVVVRRFTSLEHELKLVGMLLDADDRNFHGWSYRRFIVELMGTPAGSALEYAHKKIDHNFSNYSAWHSRTVLLPVAHGEPQQQGTGSEIAGLLAGGLASGAIAAAAAGAPAGVDPEQVSAERQQAEPSVRESQKAGGAAGQEGSSSSSAGRPAPLVPKEVLDEEYELVKQAFYTEPEDQSGWFYHRWLLGSSWAHWERAQGGEQEAAESAALSAVVLREQAMCQDLLDLEPEAKWPLLTMARLKGMQLQLLRSGAASVAGFLPASSTGHAASAAAAAGGGEAARSTESIKATACGTAAAGRDVGEQQEGALAAEVGDLYARLAEVDPMRAGYYRDAVEGRASVVMAPAAVGS